MARRREESSPSVTKWVVGALLGLPLLCCGGGFLGIRSMTPYEEALARTTHHPKVVQVLGEPVSGSFFFSGNTRSQGDDGIANLEIGLSGSKQDGVLYVRAVQTSGVWGFSRLRVVAKNGTVVNVVGN